MERRCVALVPVLVACVLSGCGESDISTVGDGVGGNSGAGGASFAGPTNNGGSSVIGTNPATGGDSFGGTSSSEAGGHSTADGSLTGGIGGAAANSETGGCTAVGGALSAIGGIASVGGAVPTGGTPATGGEPTGGASLTGGVPSAGGTSLTGGSRTFAWTGGTKGIGGAIGIGGTTMSTASYHPCPTNGDPCKILPLGDSITWGIGYDGAYRVELFTRAVAAKQKITFTGSLANGPPTVSGVTFPRRNEGHSGWTIAQDTGLVPSPALDPTSGNIPHIVLVHIGTNDIYAPSGQATMSDRLGALIDKIAGAAPDALIVVAKITPLANPMWNNAVNTYNSAIPGVVQARAQAGEHVILADMNTGFASSSMLSTDGVHPNPLGYSFMGDQWYSVISSFLPQ